MAETPPPLPNPNKRVLVLFIANLVWVAVAISLINLFGSRGDAAGMGIFFGLCAIAALVVGCVVLGVLALVQVRRYRERTSVWIRLLAWLIILTPVLLGIGTVIYVLIPRHRPFQPAVFGTHAEFRAH